MFSIMSNYGLSFAIPFPTLPHYLSIISSRRLFFVFPRRSQRALSCFVPADSRTTYTARRPLFIPISASPLSILQMTLRDGAPFFLGFFRFYARSKKRLVIVRQKEDGRRMITRHAAVRNNATVFAKRRLRINVSY